MAIRDEYQQLEAEIKKEEERRRKLDLISVGIYNETNNLDVLIDAFIYNETSLVLEDYLVKINRNLDELSKYLDLNNSEISDSISISSNDLIDGDYKKIKELDAHLNTNYLTMLFELKVIAIYLKKLQEQYFSYSSSERKNDNDIAELLLKTLNLHEEILPLYKNALENIGSIPFDIIQKYQLATFSKEKDGFHDYLKDYCLTVKQTRGLSDNEFEQYCLALSEKFPFNFIENIIIHLIINLLFLDEKPKYVQLVMTVLNQLSSYNYIPAINESLFISSHTIDEIFNLLKKFPTIAIKNLLLYFKVDGVINVIQYSSILESIQTSDLNRFKSSINNDLATSFDHLYHVIELVYSVSLLENCYPNQETDISAKYFGNVIKHVTPSIPAFQSIMINSNESYSTNASTPIPPQILVMSINNSPLLLGFFTHFYYKYRYLLHADDLRFFDQVFTQEPYKKYCDEALQELDKQYPNNKSLLEFWKFFMFDSENKSLNQSDGSICDFPAEEVSTIKLESKPKSNSKMIVNPFVGLDSKAREQCNGDKRSYVGMFIDYLIYRGYIDAENKDAYVCCLCDEMISEDTLEHLKYNDKNKEGKSNLNIVTILISKLTRFTANNQIEVNGKVISKGSMYFNDGQIENGELEEWCLFWPFLIGRNKEGKEKFKKLFQGALRSKDSKMENALKRVTSFIEDYEATKLQNPDMTKLDFIKMRHELH